MVSKIWPLEKILKELVAFIKLFNRIPVPIYSFRN